MVSIPRGRRLEALRDGSGGVGAARPRRRSKRGELRAQRRVLRAKQVDLRGRGHLRIGFERGGPHGERGAGTTMGGAAAGRVRPPREPVLASLRRPANARRASRNARATQAEDGYSRTSSKTNPFDGWQNKPFETRRVERERRFARSSVAGQSRPRGRDGSQGRTVSSPVVGWGKTRSRIAPSSAPSRTGEAIKNASACHHQTTRLCSHRRIITHPVNSSFCACVCVI